MSSSGSSVNGTTSRPYTNSTAKTLTSIFILSSAAILCLSCLLLAAACYHKKRTRVSQRPPTTDRRRKTRSFPVDSAPTTAAPSPRKEELYQPQLSLKSSKTDSQDPLAAPDHSTGQFRRSDSHHSAIQSETGMSEKTEPSQAAQGTSNRSRDENFSNSNLAQSSKTSKLESTRHLSIYSEQGRRSLRSSKDTNPDVASQHLRRSLKSSKTEPSRENVPRLWPSDSKPSSSISRPVVDDETLEAKPRTATIERKKRRVGHYLTPDSKTPPSILKTASKKSESTSSGAVADNSVLVYARVDRSGSGVSSPTINRYNVRTGEQSAVAVGESRLEENEIIGELIYQEIQASMQHSELRTLV